MASRSCGIPAVSLAMTIANNKELDTKFYTHKHGLLHRGFSREFDVCRRMRDINIEIPRSHRPLVTLHVIVREGPAIQGDLNVLALARIELNLRETFQFLYRTRNTRMPIPNIDLRDFRARASTGVCYIKIHTDWLILRLIAIR